VEEEEKTRWREGTGKECGGVGGGGGGRDVRERGLSSREDAVGEFTQVFGCPSSVVASNSHHDFFARREAPAPGEQRQLVQLLATRFEIPQPMAVRNGPLRCVFLCLGKFEKGPDHRRAHGLRSFEMEGWLVGESVGGRFDLSSSWENR
jgi:hypothetical protein